jgi:hypothetical protein
LTPESKAFATEHGLEMTLPLLSIARRLRCSRCGERKAHCWPEPYSIGAAKAPQRSRGSV